MFFKKNSFETRININLGINPSKRDIKKCGIPDSSKIHSIIKSLSCCYPVSINITDKSISDIVVPVVDTLPKNIIFEGVDFIFLKSDKNTYHVGYIGMVTWKTISNLLLKLYRNNLNESISIRITCYSYPYDVVIAKL